MHLLLDENDAAATVAATDAAAVVCDNCACDSDARWTVNVTGKNKTVAAVTLREPQVQVKRLLTVAC